MHERESIGETTVSTDEQNFDISSDFIRGHINTIILRTLYDGDKYGYEMVDELARRSDHTFELKEGTLYPLLHALEKNKCVESYVMVAPNGRERKYYRITEEGTRYLKEKAHEWQLFSQKVNTVLGCSAVLIV